MTYFGFGILAAALLYRSAMASFERYKARQDAERGYRLPTSAVSKKAKKKGRQLEGQDDGWVDMELDADADNDDNNDNDKDGKGGKGSKGKGNDKDSDDDDA